MSLSSNWYSFFLTLRNRPFTALMERAKSQTKCNTLTTVQVFIQGIFQSVIHRYLWGETTETGNGT